ncbi:inactivation-no-after-potential D protein isoform X2 [Chrysoperla carnea]|uniref:inactivation-no-after-potential D protein isoform X2 n=1 Tax=Chrysoperla carnea TaxID=189513 RepID=UPI001D075F66|nr:inactivation-no-after-potential D protein isoform X2 [Chrysoperla carnea]
MVQLERSPQGSLGLSLAGHRDRNTMAVFVVGINPNGAAHRLGAAGIQVGDEILEVNGIVLHGRCHLNASAIIKGLSGPTFKVIVLRKKSAIEDLAVRPITQFPVTLEDEVSEERFSNFKNVRTVTLKKGQQSLGIMIIEGKHAEVGQGIFISDIQEGSAAEKAGLDIGDMILAVNKDTLVNASYDTAASILKKTEGLVVLVVCNPNKRTENDATGPSAGGAGAKASAKPPSRPTSSAGKPGGLKTSAPPSRPTTPISEPVADPTTATILPGKETVIEITTESKALGLSFVGGKDTLLPKGIIVNEVYPNGSLAKDGRVKPGDQLLEVNGVKLADVTYTAASCAIRQIQPKVRLTVFRPEKPEYSIIDVELTKKPGKGVGLGVMARKTEPGVYISDILQGSVADLDGRIMRGDAVISVNGVDLTTATAEQAAATLKTAAGKIAIKLQRYKPPAPR